MGWDGLLTDCSFHLECDLSPLSLSFSSLSPHIFLRNHVLWTALSQLHCLCLNFPFRSTQSLKTLLVNSQRILGFTISQLSYSYHSAVGLRREIKKQPWHPGTGLTLTERTQRCLKLAWCSQPGHVFIYSSVKHRLSHRTIIRQGHLDKTKPLHTFGWIQMKARSPCHPRNNQTSPCIG